MSEMKKITVSLLITVMTTETEMKIRTTTIVRMTSQYFLMNDSCHQCENQTILSISTLSLMNKNLILISLKALVNTYTTEMFIFLLIIFKFLHSLKISMSYKSSYQSVYETLSCCDILLSLLK